MGGRFRLRMVEPHTFMVWGISFERFLRFVDFVQFISELTPFLTIGSALNDL